MRRAFVMVALASIAFVLSSCGGSETAWNADIEEAGFTEMDNAFPVLRERMVELDETINRRISTKRYKDEALEDFKAISDFVDILQFYYLPVLNARAMISRAYREIELGMYAEAKDDIARAVDLINKAALKSTEATRLGFDNVKEGLMEVSEISDAGKEVNLIKLANASKKLNLLIERIEPVVVVTEEGESLIEGQL